MKTNENRSAFVAHESMEAAAANLVRPAPSWSNASRCKRPPLKSAPTLFERLLSLVGFK